MGATEDKVEATEDKVGAAGDMVEKMFVLTRNGGALVEDGGNLRIHLNGCLLLTSLFMPFVYDALNPGLEGLADDGVDDVDEVLPRE